MTPSIDAGPILASGKLYYTKEIPSMGEAYIKLEKKIVEEFKIFITAIKERKVLKLENQNEEMSTYFPRLNQKIHAYIDWMWSAEDIQNFIRAFSKPFGGVKTYVNGNTLVYINNAKAIDHKVRFHPFQYGIVCKIFNNELYIIVNGGLLKIDEIASDKGESVISKIKLGDRLYTPRNLLDKALMSRARVNLDGSITNDDIFNFDS